MTWPRVSLPHSSIPLSLRTLAKESPFYRSRDAFGLQRAFILNAHAQPPPWNLQNHLSLFFGYGGGFRALSQLIVVTQVFRLRVFQPHMSPNTNGWNMAHLAGPSRTLSQQAAEWAPPFRQAVFGRTSDDGELSLWSKSAVCALQVDAMSSA